MGLSMKKSLMMLLAVALCRRGVTPTDARRPPRRRWLRRKRRRAAHAEAAKGAAGQIWRSAGRSLDDAQHLACSPRRFWCRTRLPARSCWKRIPTPCLPIASITKLMTAMVVLDAKPDLNETLTIGEDDVDMVKGTRSRLKVGTQLERARKCCAWP
jgi:D-alanyl-D-alanine endopeptidase (penicillin-binding protein 7)